MQSQLLKVIIKEADELNARYGRPRRTEIADASVSDVSTLEQLIPDEKALIIFSEGGRIKRVNDSSFATQVRTCVELTQHISRVLAETPYQQLKTARMHYDRTLHVLSL